MEDFCENRHPCPRPSAWIAIVCFVGAMVVLLLWGGCERAHAWKPGLKHSGKPPRGFRWTAEAAKMLGVDVDGEPLPLTCSPELAEQLDLDGEPSTAETTDRAEVALTYKGGETLGFSALASLNDRCKALELLTVDLRKRHRALAAKGAKLSKALECLHDAVSELTSATDTQVQQQAAEHRAKRRFAKDALASRALLRRLTWERAVERIGFEEFDKDKGAFGSIIVTGTDKPAYQIRAEKRIKALGPRPPWPSTLPAPNTTGAAQ